MTGQAAEATGRSAGNDGATSPPALTVVVHDLEQAQGALAAAAEAGCAIELCSAPGAAAYAGVGYLKALGEAVGPELLIDCGDDPGIVMAALRCGCRKVTFSGPPETAERLADMAAQCGAMLFRDKARAERFELSPEDDAARACRVRLLGRET